MNTILSFVVRRICLGALVCISPYASASAETVPFGSDTLHYLQTRAAIIVQATTARVIEDAESHVVAEADVRTTFKGEPSKTVRVYLPKSTEKGAPTAASLADAILFLTSPLKEKGLAHYQIQAREPVSMLVSRVGWIKPSDAEQSARLLSYLQIESAEPLLEWALSAASNSDQRIQRWGVLELAAQMSASPGSIDVAAISSWTDKNLSGLSVSNQKTFVRHLAAMSLQNGASNDFGASSAENQLCSIIGNGNSPIDVRVMAYQGLSAQKRPAALKEWAGKNPDRSRLFGGLADFDAASPAVRAELSEQWKAHSDPDLRDWARALSADNADSTQEAVPPHVSELRSLVESGRRKDYMAMADKVINTQASPEVIAFAQEVVASDRPIDVRERLIDALATRYSDQTIQFLAVVAADESLPEALRISALTGLGRHAKSHADANQKLVELNAKLQLKSESLSSLAKSMIIKE